MSVIRGHGISEAYVMNFWCYSGCVPDARKASRSIASSGRGQIPLTRVAVATKLFSFSQTCDRAPKKAIAMGLRVLACRTRPPDHRRKMASRDF